MKTALLFVGQGSQSPGLLKNMAEIYPQVEARFQSASAVVGRDLWAIAQGDEPHLLNSTAITQPILLAAGMACYDVLRDTTGISGDFFAGHSLGEYTALCAAGALSFEAAIDLVHQRGLLMQEAVAHGEGAMAAILGLSAEQVVALCQDAGEGVSAANFNSPEQTVVAGKTAAVERLMALAKEAGAKRALPLPVSVPSHCPLMRPAAAQLSLYLDQIDWRKPSAPVMYNVDAQLRDHCDATAALLGAQLYQPVRWVQCIEQLSASGADLFIELGPNKVLTGLNKRINPALKTVSFEQPSAVDEIKALLA